MPPSIPRRPRRRRSSVEVFIPPPQRPRPPLQQPTPAPAEIEQLAAIARELRRPDV